MIITIIIIIIIIYRFINMFGGKVDLVRSVLKAFSSVRLCAQ